MPLLKKKDLKLITKTSILRPGQRELTKPYENRRKKIIKNSGEINRKQKNSKLTEMKNWFFGNFNKTDKHQVTFSSGKKKILKQE